VNLNWNLIITNSAMSTIVKALILYISLTNI